MPCIPHLAGLVAGLLLSLSLQAKDIDAASYCFPLDNPFEATIATTPLELRPELPLIEDIDQADYAVKLRPEREFELPENFWPVTKMRYRLAEQKGPAPLIFIIAGTAAHNTHSPAEYHTRLFYRTCNPVVKTP